MGDLQGRDGAPVVLLLAVDGCVPSKSYLDSLCDLSLHAAGVLLDQLEFEDLTDLLG